MAQHQVNYTKDAGLPVALTTIDKVVNWGRSNSLWALTYGLACCGIEMMTRVLAQELAPFQIQVNAVAPSMVKTGFSQPFWSNQALHDQIVKTIPLGRIPEPSDIAHPVLFLCSSGADFITGHTVMVDGGASAV